MIFWVVCTTFSASYPFAFLKKTFWRIFINLYAHKLKILMSLVSLELHKLFWALCCIFYVYMLQHICNVKLNPNYVLNCRKVILRWSTSTRLDPRHSILLSHRSLCQSSGMTTTVPWGDWVEGQVCRRASLKKTVLPVKTCTKHTNTGNDARLVFRVRNLVQTDLV
jgi:hypothetical protein